MQFRIVEELGPRELKFKKFISATSSFKLNLDFYAISIKLMRDFYSLTFKKISFCRKLVRQIRKFASYLPRREPPYLLSKNKDYWFDLQNISDNNPVKIIADIEFVKVERPQIFSRDGDVSRQIISEDDYAYSFPQICLYSFNNAHVFSRSNMIFYKDKCIHHNLYQALSDYTSEEMHGHIKKDFHLRRVKRVFYVENEIKIEKAATFLDACAFNYAHWMTEVLPRISLFCSLQEYKDVPIILDAGLHVNILESLTYFIDQKREVFIISDRQSVLVGKLFAVSSAGYVPFQPRNFDEKPKNQGQFSKAAVGLIRASVHRQTALTLQTVKYRKIFLKRASNYRSLKNSKEIEEFLISLGFLSIDPAKLTFQEQFSLFSQADEVVGAIGAAFSNIIFCKPSCKIWVLLAENPQMLYWYWQAVANTASANVKYVIGVPDDRSTVHSDFCIDLDVLRNSLNYT